MASESADRSGPPASSVAERPHAEAPRASTGAVPLACVAYVACLLGGALALGNPPVSWLALPVLLGALRGGLRVAMGVSLLLGALTLAVYLAFGPRADPVATLAPWLLGVPLIGAAVGRARDLRQREIDRAHASAERHTLAAGGSGDGLFEWELDPGRVHYGEGFAALLDVAPDALGAGIDGWFSRVHVDDLPVLRAAIDAHLEGATQQLSCEHRVRRADGAWLWVLARAKAAHDARGRALRLAGWLRDIHDRKQSEDELRRHAFHDPLTGLPNRALFMDRLGHALTRTRVHASERFAVALVDLDHFKAINDKLGHAAGDALLLATGQRLEGCLRPGDTVARIGGDEFVLLLEDVGDGEHARRVAERVQRALALPLPLSGQDVLVSASIGVAVGDPASADALALLHDADAAMYDAKARGPGQLVTFDARTHDRARERFELESALRSAITRGELRVDYQPIVALADGRIVGVEALARFRHPSLGQVAPLRFIPLAEESGLIVELGAWVLAQATSEAARLHRACPDAGSPTVHVNLSARQVEQDPDLPARIDRALADSGLAPQQLTIELTEAAVLEDLERGERLLGALRARGVHVCIDDFGTGYSSLSALHRFRVDSLKIDLSFVRELTVSGGKGELVHTILTLARSLGMSAIAEGIETPAQRARLLALGCERGQGFLFSPPVDAPSVEALLRTPPRWVA